jgi:hypothetical protein
MEPTGRGDRKEEDSYLRYALTLGLTASQGFASVPSSSLRSGENRNQRKGTFLSS